VALEDLDQEAREFEFEWRQEGILLWRDSWAIARYTENEQDEIIAEALEAKDRILGEDYVCKEELHVLTLGIPLL